MEKIVLITLSVLTGAAKVEIDLRYNNVDFEKPSNVHDAITVVEVITTSIRLVSNSYMTS